MVVKAISIKIKIPLIITSFSIIGILMFQWLWFNNMYNIRKNELQSNLFLKLEATTYNETTYRYANGIGTNNFLSASVDYTNRSITVKRKDGSIMKNIYPTVNDLLLANKRIE